MLQHYKLIKQKETIGIQKKTLLEVIYSYINFTRIVVGIAVFGVDEYNEYSYDFRFKILQQ